MDSRASPKGETKRALKAVFRPRRKRAQPQTERPGTKTGRIRR